MKTSVLQGDLYKKKKKKDYKVTTRKLNSTPHQVSPTLRSTYREPTKLNGTQREMFENNMPKKI